MKLHKAINANIILFLLPGILPGLFGITGVGAAILVAGIDAFLILIYLIQKNTAALKTALLCNGILLLIGFSICSVFTFKYRPGLVNLAV